MIYYRLETNLKGKALDKMQEIIPPIMQYASNVIEQYSTVEDIISGMKELPFETSNWIDHQWVPEFEVHIHLSRSSYFQSKAVFDFKDIIRDIKIDKIISK